MSSLPSIIYNQKIVTLEESYSGVDKTHGGENTTLSVTTDNSLISGNRSTHVLVIVTGYSNNHFLAGYQSAGPCIE